MQPLAAAVSCCGKWMQVVHTGKWAMSGLSEPDRVSASDHLCVNVGTRVGSQLEA